MNKILAAVGTKKSTLVFQLSEFKGIRTLDIRKHFYDTKSKKLIATRKGISLAEKTFAVVQNILTQHEEVIREWLDKRCETSKGVSKDVSIQKSAIVKARNDPRDYIYEESELRSPLFFLTEGQGGRDKIILNTGHAFYNRLNNLRVQLLNDRSVSNGERISRELLEIMNSLLLAFSRSQRLFDNSSDMPPDNYLDTLLFNWGTILQNYLDEG
ncbi:MAG: PC4/YdbC family ssDNA-binding protein [candidate division Zixibacteria bacterium]|nr:PC4/YdbC family ssDNA-binding protein [candidate division Zixibacteria bacterium]